MLASLCALFGEATVSYAQASTAATAPRHWSVLGKYCEGCHNTEDWAGGVAFDALTPAEIPEDAQTWEKAVRKLRTGMMPPAGKPRPSRSVLDDFARQLATRLDQAESRHPVAGIVAPHRLNRTEYANAIRDLLGLSIDAATLLPADDAGEGFDNIADVLSVSPTLVQSYISAAMKISRWAVGDRSMVPALVKYSAPAGLSQQEHSEGLPLGTRGGIRVTHNFPLDAEYEFRVSAGTGFRFAGPAGGPPPTVDVTHQRTAGQRSRPAQISPPREGRAADHRGRDGGSAPLGWRGRPVLQSPAAPGRLREPDHQRPVQCDRAGRYPQPARDLRVPSPGCRRRRPAARATILDAAWRPKPSAGTCDPSDPPSTC